MTISRLDDTTPWLKVFVEYGLGQKPFILAATCTEKWSSRKNWTTAEGTPNFQFLRETYGKTTVPLLCRNCEYTSSSFSDYINQVQKGNVDSDIYLKDWHFQQSFGMDMYSLHPFFAMDWINCEPWTENGNPFGEDYRFVYFGVAGTWTKFHSDVVSSHSWSANICGRKKWFMIAPGDEEHFRKPSGDFYEDMREVNWAGVDVIEFVQEAGEVVFVPSNWYHQVHNLTDAISINHNWINSTNIKDVRKFVEKRLEDVRKELEDSKDFFTEEEFEKQIELVLFADARLNTQRLLRLLSLVVDSRSDSETCFVCPTHGFRFNLCQSLCKQRLMNQCTCTVSRCALCTTFIKAFELTVASTVLFDQ